MEGIMLPEPNLAKLPHDIYILIISELKNSGPGIQEFAALSRTCRVLHLVVEPSLYEQIEWIRDEIFDDAPPVYLILRTIMRRLSLVDHIRSVYLRGWHRGRTPYSKVRKSYTDEELSSIHRDCINMNQVTPGPWLDGFEFAKTDLFVAIFLSRCDQLEFLNIDFHHGHRESLVGLVLTQRVLLQLTYVVFSTQKAEASIWNHANENYGVSIDYLANVLKYRDIGSIYMHDVSSRALSRVPSDFTNSLRTLTLDRVACAASEVAALLNMTKCLRHLVWNHVIICKDPLSEPYHCAAILVALTRIEATLETLTLGVEFYETLSKRVTMPLDHGYHPEALALRGKLGWMKSFPKLEKLEAPLVILMGWHQQQIPIGWRLADQLPDALTHLTVTDATLGMPNMDLGTVFPFRCLYDYVSVAWGLESMVVKRNIASSEMDTECAQLESLCSWRGIAWAMHKDGSEGFYE